MPRAFWWPVRVYWEDTDAGGVVYYANYLRFMERARSEWLRALGFDQAGMQRDERIQFAVVEVAIRYHKPAVYDDLLDVGARVVAWKRASLSFEQEIRRGGATGELLVSATVRAAALDSETLKPRPMPQALVTELERE